MRTWTEGNALVRLAIFRSPAAVGTVLMKGAADDPNESEPAATGDRPPNRARGQPLASDPSSRQPAARAQLLFMVLDAACVVAGYSAAEVFFWRNVAPTAYGWHFALFVLIVIVVTLLCNQIYGLYGRMWRHAGLEEARQIILSSGTVAAFLLVIYMAIQLAGFQVVHAEVLLIGLILATLGMSLIRFQSRIFAWQRGSRGNGLRVAIVGSRDEAASAVREMIRHPDAGLIPVAVFDDDASVHGMSLIGVPIVGSIRDIPAAASRYTLQEVLLAIPDASPELIAEVLHVTEAAGITMKVLPTVHDVVTGRSGMFAIRRAREPSIEDLLGRTPVATDLEGVRLSLESHRVGWSPVPAVLSARRSAVRSPVSTRTSWSCSTTTRPISTTSRPSLDGPCRQAPCRHHRPRHALRSLRAVPTGHRAPRGRPQARSGPRTSPGRGGPDQRVRDPQCGSKHRLQWESPAFYWSRPTKPCDPRASWVLPSERRNRCF